MSEEEFWDETLRATQLRIEGYNRKEERRERADWERTRWLAALVLQPYAQKGKRIQPRDLARFEWDAEAAKPVDKSRKQAIFDKWDAEMKQRNGQ